jgi:hypothetical protein
MIGRFPEVEHCFGLAAAGLFCFGYALLAKKED